MQVEACKAAPLPPRAQTKVPLLPSVCCLSQIFVRSLSGSTVTVNGLESTNTVAAACAMVAQKEGFQVDGLRMVFEGKQLEMSSPLADYSVQHGVACTCPL